MTTEIDVNSWRRKSLDEGASGWAVFHVSPYNPRAHLSTKHQPSSQDREGERVSFRASLAICLIGVLFQKIIFITVFYSLCFLFRFFVWYLRKASHLDMSLGRNVRSNRMDCFLSFSQKGHTSWRTGKGERSEFIEEFSEGKGFRIHRWNYNCHNIIF